MAIEPSAVGAAIGRTERAPDLSDLANLERCIGLLAAQTLLRSEFEVVVADNNSRRGLNEARRVCGGIA